MTNDTWTSQGEVVCYRNPSDGEQYLTFVVLENHGDRLHMQSLDWTIGRFAPIETVDPIEVVNVASFDS